MLLNRDVGEDSWESFGLQEIQPVHLKGNQSWIFIGRTDAEAETPILWPPNVKNWLIWKDPDTGKDWRQEEYGDNRGWDSRMASPTQWTWVWVNSGSWWWTGRPGLLQSMGLQRVRHDWVTELNWTEEPAQKPSSQITLRSCFGEAGYSAWFYIFSEQRTLNKSGLHFFNVSKKRPAHTQWVRMASALGEGVFIIKGVPALASQEGEHLIFHMNIFFYFCSMCPFLK